ncbi:uncharacterized protein [Antedon mediterranea]|uniref:uncharacterized protein n=1 Tax=Antedon mediterranea TaxID=105859 RepID=UPI003AF6E5ED
MGAANGKPRPTIRSAVEVVDQSDEEIDIIDLEYSDYFDDVFEDNEPVKHGTLRKIRLWDFPYSSPTKNGKRAASESGGIAFTRRGLYSESDVITPPKPDYGTILNHGRKRIQSAKEARSNSSKRSNLLRKLFTKPEKKSDPDSDVYQANAFRRHHIPSSSAMGTCCSTSKSISSLSTRQSETFAKTFPHKRECSGELSQKLEENSNKSEFETKLNCNDEKASYKREFEGGVSYEREIERASHKREFEGVTRKPSRPQDKNSENDKNQSNIVRLSNGGNTGYSNGQNSTDIWVGRESPKQNKIEQTHDLMINDDRLKHVDGRHKPRPLPRTFINNGATEARNSSSASVRKIYMQQNNSHRQRKLTPAVPLTVPGFKAPLRQSSLPPVGDVEELLFERDNSSQSRSSKSTPTKVKTRPPPIQYHLNSSPCSSSWPSLSNGDGYQHHIPPPSTPPHKNLLSPSPKHLLVSARHNHMLPKRKLVRKLTPIILEVPKNLEGRNNSLSSDEEDETHQFLHNGVYGYESMVEGTPKSNGYGPSDEYREELKNTVDELIDQLSPTIMGDEFIDRPYGRRSPSYWRKQPSQARNFVFPEVRRVEEDNGKLETTFPPTNGYSGDASPSLAPLNPKVHRRKITPALSVHPPLYRLDQSKMAFNSFVEDEDQF